MKKVVVVLVFLVSNILAQAQVDPKAQEILKSVSVKYKSFKTVRII